MSFRRFAAVFRLEFATALRRPLFWTLVGVIALLTFGLATGEARVGAGDDTVGAKRVFLNSEFAFARVFAVLTMLLYVFFGSVACGMAVPQDDEHRVGDLLHSTPLRPAEYVLGKFLGSFASILLVLAIHVGLAMLFDAVVPIAHAEDLRGPFSFANYLRPAAVFGLPTTFFACAAAFATGTLFRRAILVFLLPVFLIVACIFFVWFFSPVWLPTWANEALILADPAGFRWLRERWLLVDRGADFYNTARIPLDGSLLLNRLLFLGIGSAAILLSIARFGRALRGGSGAGARAPLATARTARASGGDGTPTAAPLAALAMSSRPPRFLASALAVARIEARELRSQPGLYLFVPLILIQTLGSTALLTGAFDTPLLLTSGQLAARFVNTLTTLVCLLLLFYAVESLRRDESTGLAPIQAASPVRTGALLLGKATASCLVALAVLSAAFLASVAIQAIQGRVRIELAPYALVWGLLLAPTFFLWVCFVAALHAITKNRYATYGLGLASLAGTGWLQLTGNANWITNWNLWDAVLWSDIATFELDRGALALNRALALLAGAFFLGVAVRYHPRRESDPVLTLRRLEPAQWLRRAPRMLAFAALPAAAALALGMGIRAGFQGVPARERARDAWRKHLATWLDAPKPDLTRVELDVTIDPAARRYRVSGAYELRNGYDEPMKALALSVGLHWESVAWACREPVRFEESLGLVVIRPTRPLATGDSLRAEFRYEATHPKGITRNGGGLAEFVLPSGVVLTSFRPLWVPTVGFDPERGADEEHPLEPRRYPEDGYVGFTEPLFGSASGFTTRIAIHGPRDFTFNSVGVLASDATEGDMRTVVWESDHPVRFFNIVGGRYVAERGEGTVLYRHAGHPYNAREMLAALDAARKWYSEWFAPFPWMELRVSEFPALAGYAQGFPTNISFSEGVGFLTKDDPETSLAFMVTAHEAAHQWWGNMVTPGKFPGANVIAEALAHTSTALLFEQAKGPRHRMEFLKHLEAAYARSRRVDLERPLVEIDNTKEGDTTATYDKGGWAWWMTMRHLGRERFLGGLRRFVETYRDGHDFPVVQDLLAVLRPLAPDPGAFDAFARQWFFEIVLPQYQLSEVVRERDGEGWIVRGRLRNAGTGRMPVEVAACSAKDRFDAAGQETKGYRDARTLLDLGAGEERSFSVRCEFEPARVLVDPDVHVLQLERHRAAHGF